MQLLWRLLRIWLDEDFFGRCILQIWSENNGLGECSCLYSYFLWSYIHFLFVALAWLEDERLKCSLAVQSYILLLLSFSSQHHACLVSILLLLHSCQRTEVYHPRSVGINVATAHVRTGKKRGVLARRRVIAKLDGGWFGRGRRVKRIHALVLWKINNNEFINHNKH